MARAVTVAIEAVDALTPAARAEAENLAQRTRSLAFYHTLWTAEWLSVKYDTIYLAMDGTK